MAQAICIVTSTGLKCIASPLKHHRPGAKACGRDRDYAKWDRKAAAVAAALEGSSLRLGAKRCETLGKIAVLLQAAEVGPDTPFTIVRAG